MNEAELNLIKSSLSIQSASQDPAVLQTQLQALEHDLLAEEMRLRHSFGERNRKAQLLAEYRQAHFQS